MSDHRRWAFRHRLHLKSLLRSDRYKVGVSSSPMVRVVRSL
ncbi:MAG TPA: hypothetical protein VK184_07660 [Nostocaceae cyanobacterium]|nr:hypothetical protein [Nostocaceae cyanobacterium]